MPNLRNTRPQEKNKQILAIINFNRRKQPEGKKFDSFIKDLRPLVQNCGYGDEERMIRDAIVLRAFNHAVRENA